MESSRCVPPHRRSSAKSWPRGQHGGEIEPHVFRTIATFLLLFMKTACRSKRRRPSIGCEKLFLSVLARHSLGGKAKPVGRRSRSLT
jgi:hypothetical protein